MIPNALLLGSSGGIGTALSTELTRKGYNVTGLSRTEHGLDITSQASVDELLSALNAPYHLIFIATGLLAPSGARPEKALSQIKQPNFEEVFAVNALGPAYVLKHAPRLLPKQGRSVLALLTARVGSIGDNHMGGWYAYRASKAAANQLLRGAAIELRRTHKDAIAAALHPGTVATPFTAEYTAHHKTVPPQEAAANIANVLEGLRPENSGQFLDYAGKNIEW